MTTIARLNRSMQNEAAARSLGRTVGIQIASWFVALGFLSTLWGGMVNPETLGGQLGLLAMWGVPTLVAGSIAGRLFGPRAGRARSGGDWARVIAMLAIVAALVGDVGVSVAMAIGYAIGGGSTNLANVLLGALVMPIYGLLVVPFVLPVTLVASWIWAVRMRRAMNAANARPAAQDGAMAPA